MPYSLRCLTFALFSGLLFSLMPLMAWGQTYPLAEDVETLDGIINAYYEVVSGPAGQARQWERDHSLHHPEAQVAIVRTGEDGQPDAAVMTLAEYHERSGATSQGFFEYEIHRETQRHGHVVHVWSTYEWRTTEDGPVGGRGINSIQLYYDGQRWWITSWIFDGTRDAPPVPDAYLPSESKSQH